MTLLEGRRAVVVGAGNGIGRQAALAGVLDRDAEATERTVEEVEAAVEAAVRCPAETFPRARLHRRLRAGIQLAGEDIRADRFAIEV